MSAGPDESPRRDAPVAEVTVPAPGSGPTFWQVARRPRWILALVVALAIAGIFAFLGQWQLGRSIDASRQTGPDTETIVPLRELSQPQTGVGSESAWRKAKVTLRVVPGDTIVLSGRVNTDAVGWWVVGHTLDPEGASLAVAAGWAPTLAAAEAAATAFDAAGDLGEVSGRYLPTEAPQESDFMAGERSALSTGELVNDWAGVDGIHNGYLVLDTAPPGLTAIDAPAPEREVEVDFLNLFYAFEWAIFAAAAVFIWWRLVRDELEKVARPAGDETAAAK